MKNAKQKGRGRSPDDRRRKELALIHVAANQLEYSQEAYRDLLWILFGKHSAGKLNATERRALIDHFKDLGFQPVHKSARKSGMHRPASWDRAPQLSKIGAILADTGKPWSYADAIANQMFGVDRVRWLYPDQLRGVLVALIKESEKAE